MKMPAVVAVLPSRKVSNAERVAQLVAANLHLSLEAQRKLGRTANALLALSGARTRFECGPGETPRSLAMAAGQRALELAGWSPASLDGVISGAVSRACLEPATAAVLASALEVPRAQCFDISEACMGWLRAVQVAQLYLDAGVWKRALILNVETNTRLASLKLSDVEAELPHTLPQLTIGEAATATLLEAGGEPWPLWFASAPAGQHLCELTLPGGEGFRDPETAFREAFRFYCHFGEMNRFTLDHFGGLYQRFLEGEVRGRGRPVDCVLTHASEATGWQRWAESNGLSGVFHTLYPSVGNVVSASIPAGLAQAVHEGKLKAGGGLYLYVASSGMGVGGGWLRWDGLSAWMTPQAQDQSA